MTKKIRIRLGYPYDPSGRTFTGLSQAQLLYSYLSQQEDFEIVESERGVDAFLFFNGGHGGGAARKKWRKLLQLLGAIGEYFPPVGARALNSPNVPAERELERMRKSNPKMKLIHRLDDRYLFLCKNYGYDKTVARVNQQADATILQSKYCGELYAHRNQSIFGELPARPLRNPHLIYNGVDRSVFCEHGPRMDLPGKTRIVHVSATGMPRKGLSTVLIMAELLQHNEDIHFFLIGNQLRDPLSGYCIKRLRNVTHIPMIMDRMELAKHLRSMDVLVFPSRYDCAPNVVLEAMSCGLAVVAHDSGGTPELMIKDDVQAGLLLQERNPVQAVKTVLENLPQFKHNAVEIVKRHHMMEHTGAQYAEVIRNLVAGKG